MGKSGKCDVGGGDQQLSILLSSPSQTLFSSFAIFSRARLPCCWTGCWMALTGTSATAVNSLVTGPPAESNVSAELLLPAPLAQTSSVASAPIHAPYWRRRGLSVQIISPLPPEPLSAPGQTTFLELQHQLPLLSVPLRYVRDKRPQGRKQLTPEVPTTTCEVLKFKARDRDIESQFRCCDCVKFPPSHYTATPWASESLQRKIFVKSS